MDMIKRYPDFAPTGLINAALAQWPARDWSHWHRYTGEHGDKLASKDPARLPTACLELIRLMAVMNVGDDGCFPDLDLHAAGMHWIPEGGCLPLHRDAEVHPLKGWRRRFNAVLYLDSCEGGQLRFDTGQTVHSFRNTLVMFPVLKPHEVLPVTKGDRRSLSLFWWDHEPCSGETHSDFNISRPGGR